VKVVDNVIIGAGAVVFKDINSNTVFAGNSAKQI
jgi:acetyltransferase-like isoleucine patch superfamily enzyme